MVSPLCRFADWDLIVSVKALFIGKHALLLIFVVYSSLRLTAVALCSVLL